VQCASGSATIGGTTPAAQNIISGNRGNGVDLGPQALYSVVEGNYIGTDASGATTTASNGQFLGNEGDGVQCFTSSPNRTQQDFLGFMVYDRTWFDHDKFGFTFGGGAITNPGRYLVLLPPINGATASTGSPYFTQNPGDQFKAWDMSATFDYMPNQYITWRAEYNHRQSNVPYFAGEGGMTPAGGDTGTPGTLVSGFTPDLRRSENRVTLAMLIRL